MQQLFQKCKINNHNEKPVIRFCSFKYCFTSRYLCQTCLEQNLHDHSQENSNHIVDPALFKKQVDERVQELKKILELYQLLEIKIRNIYGIIGQKQELFQTQLKNEQERLLQLISKTDILNKPITMISERNIQLGSNLIKDIILKRHSMFYKVASQYYENLHNTINQLTPQLQEIQTRTQELHIDNFGASNYTKTIIKNLKVSLSRHILSRDELYFVFTDCKNELYIYDIKQNNMLIQFSGMKNQVTCILFIECDNNLILGDSKGLIYLFKFNKSRRQITEQQQQNLNCGKIIQIFDMLKQNEFIVYCINGKILIIDIFDGQIIKQFQLSYDIYSIMSYQQNLQILVYPIGGFLKLYQIQRFELILSYPYQYEMYSTYKAVFSIKGSYLALFSQDQEFLDIYQFEQKPKTNLSLFKRIQQHCINIQWIMNDDCIVMQMLENTKIVQSETLEDIKIIHTDTINLTQCYESKQISYIIDFEIDQIVRYDC